MFIENILQIAIYQGLLGRHDRPDCGGISQFRSKEPSRKPDHGSVPVNIISTGKALLVTQMIVPCLFAGSLIQVPHYCVNTQVQSSQICFYKVKPLARCQLTSSCILERLVSGYIQSEFCEKDFRLNTINSKAQVSFDSLTHFFSLVGRFPVVIELLNGLHEIRVHT